MEQSLPQRGAILKPPVLESPQTMAVTSLPPAENLGRRFESVRNRTEALFAVLSPEAFFTRPLPLRHPICFYRGHLAAFNVNTLLKRMPGGEAGVKPSFETLFERGIDPANLTAAEKASIRAWPERDEIEDYVRRVDQLMRAALEEIESGRAGAPILRQAAHTCLEHEPMHQETLLYIFHRLPHGQKHRPAGYPPLLFLPAASAARVQIPAGEATLGADRGEIPFGWDNEFPRHRVTVPGFEIDVDDVTNGRFLEFVEAGGYDAPRYWDPEDWRWRRDSGTSHPLYWERRDGGWSWRAMFEDVALPLSWPVYVSQAEAKAFAKWEGRRLPTEAEFHRAAYGTPQGAERPYPWGEEAPEESRGNFDFVRWDPLPAGSCPAGASAWRVRDLLGNGWEWTSTVWSGFPGFSPMETYPKYSADFFDGNHFVLKGGSPATAVVHLRRSFRNWFQPRYPYPYATFRCASAVE